MTCRCRRRFVFKSSFLRSFCAYIYNQSILSGVQWLSLYSFRPGLIALLSTHNIVRGDQDSRATLMPIYGDLYQIKL